MGSINEEELRMNIIIIAIAIFVMLAGIFLLFFGIPNYHIEDCLDNIAEDYCLENNFTGLSEDFLGSHSFMCNMEFDRVLGEMSQAFLFSEEERDYCLKKDAWSLKTLPLKSPINELQGGKKE